MSNQSTRWSAGPVFVQAALMVVVLAMAASSAIGASPPDTLVWDIAAGPQYVDPVMGTAARGGDRDGA